MRIKSNGIVSRCSLNDIPSWVVSILRGKLNEIQRSARLPRVTWLLSFSHGNTVHTFWFLVKGFSCHTLLPLHEIFSNLLHSLGFPYLAGDCRVAFLSQGGYFLAKRTILEHALSSLAELILRRGSFKATISKAAILLSCVWCNASSIPRR